MTLHVKTASLPNAMDTFGIVPINSGSRATPENNLAETFYKLFSLTRNGSIKHTYFTDESGHGISYF